MTTLKDLREKYRNHAFSDMLADIELAAKLGADAERSKILAGITRIEKENVSMARGLSSIISIFIRGRSIRASIRPGRK